MAEVGRGLPRPSTLTGQLVAIRKQHPEWCEKEVAYRLGRSWATVRHTARYLQARGLIEPFPPALTRYRTFPELRNIRPPE